MVRDRSTIPPDILCGVWLGDLLTSFMGVPCLDVAQHRGVRVRRLESKVTEEGANLGQEGASEEGEEEEEIEGMQESTGARMMVEELMLLAGEIAGKFAEARGIPIPFRVQQRPPVCVPSSPLSSPAALLLICCGACRATQNI
jgi:hypothetical protein